jgi:tetrahydromethanopterin S-methyltransferase subunit E
MVKLTGLFLGQYMFVWNWKKIIDPNGWQVIVAGLTTWLILILLAVIVVGSEQGRRSEASEIVNKTVDLKDA